MTPSATPPPRSKTRVASGKRRLLGRATCATAGRRDRRPSYSLWVLAAVVLLGAASAASGGRPGAVAVAKEAPASPPNDPLFKHQWHLGAIQIPAAWAVSRGAGATVAVLDTGVAYENRGRYRRAPDLAGTRFVDGWDFVDGDAHPNDEAPRAGQSHGTHIAGIVAQTTGNGLGGAGVAPKAAIMPVRVLKADQSGSARTIARGLRYAADHGADVANLSIAGPTGRKVLEDAVAYAASKGVTVVASAGNEGGSSVAFPAAYPEVLAVGAVLRDRRLAYYSNRGEALDLVAPAGDRDAQGAGSGDGVLQQALNGGPSTFCYCFMSSTSAAAAQVSGVAALIVASGRAEAPSAVRSALLSSAQDLGPPGRDSEYGAGLVAAARAVGADEAHRRRPAAARSRSSERPWLVWLALATAVVGATGLTGLVITRRRR